MAVICPRCHLSGQRVEMKSSFLRYEEHLTDVPCDTYPDGTVVTEVQQKSETAVFKFECPVCGMAVESRNRTELPTATESP